jgi:hypothetical protein
MAVVFERVGPDPGTPAWVDGRPAEIVAVRSTRDYAKVNAGDGSTYVFAVPPGRWRLSMVATHLFSVSFCLGAPAFDLAAGEAVYAGSYQSDGVAPDMSMDAAKAAFPPMSTVPAMLKPANWVNGVQSNDCHHSAYAYALDIPGRPFVAGAPRAPDANKEDKPGAR